MGEPLLTLIAQAEKTFRPRFAKLYASWLYQRVATFCYGVQNPDVFQNSLHNVFWQQFVPLFLMWIHQQWEMARMFFLCLLHISKCMQKHTVLKISSLWCQKQRRYSDQRPPSCSCPHHVEGPRKHQFSRKLKLNVFTRGYKHRANFLEIYSFFLIIRSENVVILCKFLEQ